MEFDVNNYRSSLKEKINRAYDAYDIVLASNIGSNSRPVVLECLDNYISLLNRRLFNSYSYGDTENGTTSNVSSI